MQRLKTSAKHAKDSNDKDARPILAADAAECSRPCSGGTAQRSASVVPRSGSGLCSRRDAQEHFASEKYQEKVCSVLHRSNSSPDSVPEAAGIVQDEGLSPDIPGALANLGMTAKELFSCNGEKLPAFASEQKLASFLQQLWKWAVQLGKIDAGAPLSLPHLDLVVQWGLQRMRAGAVQGRDQWEQQHQQEQKQEEPQILAPQPRPQPRQGLIVPSTSAATSGQDPFQGTEVVGRGEVANDHSPSSNETVEDAALAQQQEGDDAFHDYMAHRPQVGSDSPGCKGTAAPSPALQLSKDDVVGGALLKEEGNPGGCSLIRERSSLRGSLLSSWLSMLPSGLSRLSEGSAGLQQGRQWAGSGQQQQQPWSLSPMHSARHSTLPPGPFSAGAFGWGASPFESTLPAAMTSFPTGLSTQMSTQHSEQIALLHTLDTLIAGTPSPQPGFIAALQQVLQSFGAELAAQGALLEYSLPDLRQACTFLIRQLDASQKQWLAQDPAELFSVVLQTCGLVQQIDRQVQELHQSVSHKVARIAGRRDTPGEGLAQPGWGTWPFGGSKGGEDDQAFPHCPPHDHELQQQQQQQEEAREGAVQGQWGSKGPRKRPAEAGHRRLSGTAADEQHLWAGGPIPSHVPPKVLGEGDTQDAECVEHELDATVAQQLLSMMQSHLG